MILYGIDDQYTTTRYGETDSLDPYREQLFGGHTSYMEQLLDGHDSYVSYVLDGLSESNAGYRAATGQVEPYSRSGAATYDGPVSSIRVVYRGMYVPDYR